MYIVYDVNNNVDLLHSKYLVLELDTVEFLDGKTITAYAVIDNQHITLQEMSALNIFKKLHHELMENYRIQNWGSCEKIITQLRGSFNGEIDSFYDVLSNRIKSLKESNIGPDWTGNIKANSA